MSRDALQSHIPPLNAAKSAFGRVAPLSTKQFLYSLSRTPNPARFQKGRVRLQIPSGLRCLFRANGTQDDFIHHDTRTGHANLPLGNHENHVTLRENPVAQIDLCQDEDMRRDETLNAHTIDYQLEATAEADAWLKKPDDSPRRVAVGELVLRQDEEPILEGLEQNYEELTLEQLIGITNLATHNVASTNAVSTNEELSRIDDDAAEDVQHFSASARAMKGSNISAKHTSPFVDDVEEEEAGMLLRNENGHLNILAVESNEAFVGVDGCMLLNDVECKAEARHSASIHVAPLISEMKYSQRTKECGFESPFVEDSSNDVDEYQAAPIPAKKQVERPNGADPQKDARNTVLPALKERRVQKKTRKPRCAPVDELYLTEEKFCSREDSEYGPGTIDENDVTKSFQRISEDSHAIMQHSPYRKRHSRNLQISTKKSSKRKQLPLPLDLSEFKIPNHAATSRNSHKHYHNRLDFCDGFTGKEAQPTGHNMLKIRSRRRTGAHNARQPMHYVGQLLLVHSRTFGDEIPESESQEFSQSVVDIRRPHRPPSTSASETPRTQDLDGQFQHVPVVKAATDFSEVSRTLSIVGMDPAARVMRAKSMLMQAGYSDEEEEGEDEEGGEEDRFSMTEDSFGGMV